MPAARSRSSSTAASRVGERAGRRSSRAHAGSLAQRSRASWSSIISDDEPLLRAVVEVAAEAAALGVARLDDPRARRAQRLEPRAQLDLEPPVLERQRRGARAAPQQLGLLAQRGVVDERADAPAVVAISVTTARRPRGGSSIAPAVAVDVALAPRAASRRPSSVGSPSAARSASRTPAAPRSAASRVDQPPDRGGAEEAAARRGRAGTRPGSSANADRNATLRRFVLHDEECPAERDDHGAEQQHRVEPAALDPARGPPPPGQQHDGGDAAPRARRPARASRARRPRPERRRCRARPPAALAGRAERSPSRSRRRRSRAPRRPASRPDGNASRRWTSSATISVSHSPPSTNGARRPRTAGPPSGVARPTAIISAPVRLSGPAEPREGAGRDEPPRPRDPDIRRPRPRPRAGRRRRARAPAPPRRGRRRARRGRPRRCAGSAS